MPANDPNLNLTPREAAKLGDAVARGALGHDMGRAAGGAMANRVEDRALTAGAVAPVTNSIQTKEITSSLKQARNDQARKLENVTPSVEAKDVPASKPPPEDFTREEEDTDLDVGMFARGNVDKVVNRYNLQAAEQERRAVAKKANLPFARILGYPISPEVLAIIPREIAEKHGAIAYLKVGKKVRLGITNPSDPQAFSALKELQENTGFEFMVSVIADDSYRYAMKLYDELPGDRANISDVTLERGKLDAESAVKSLAELKNRIVDVPTTKLIDTILAGAVSIGSSDVHIEPTETGVLIRYRMDGVLQNVVELPKTVTNSILNRLKFLAKLKFDISKNPQDGRFTIKDTINGQDHDLDVRVGSIPVQYGEAVTMRLLDRESIAASMDTLGLTAAGMDMVMEAISKPQGLILECGPTGSGKTTTLYTILETLNDPTKKIITLEDPVEYRLKGIMQSQVAPENGYDFGEGFRSVLRLDPDIVMVGEIRDDLTAEMAVQAALTGHIVLSTVHTNDAPTAIPRLIDLNVRPFLLSNAVNVIVAQRLVRMVCAHCTEEYKLTPAEIEEVITRISDSPAAKAQMPDLRDWVTVRGKGCEYCNNTGYRGRIGIFELLKPTREIEELAINHAPAGDIKRTALQMGMVTMEADGLLKAVTGITTIEEVWRVARDI